MGTLILDIAKQYTYADYLGWIDDKRRELINGFVKAMSPAPKRIHQEILTNLSFEFVKYFKHKRCKVYIAPFDVRLPLNGEKEDNKILTVVQPDICVVCDLTKLDSRGCLGAPDLIIEITSPNTIERDVNEKFKIYEQSCVREYWIVYPNEQSITVFVLQNRKFSLVGMFAGKQQVKVSIFDDLIINLNEIFEEFEE